MSKKNVLPDWATGLTWKIAAIMGGLKIIGMVFEIPVLATIPIWAWSPFTLSVFFLLNWTIWIVGISVTIMVMFGIGSDGSIESEEKNKE